MTESPVYGAGRSVGSLDSRGKVGRRTRGAARCYQWLVVWRRGDGEPCLRPETGRVLLAPTLAMDLLQTRAATCSGDGSWRPAVLLDVLAKKCRVKPTELGMEEASPPSLRAHIAYTLGSAAAWIHWACRGRRLNLYYVL